ncbi:hypothetical protein K402DRAFT_341425 [Aulographum hederae CBS 113979]|uniref:Major facilitator superfamily transporter n=1 Tax=Aulographum hederae CBS 113979 TaxID=1176131 RepID=A0A6G1GLR6_9PEZI|nr:hypothetical protein K402DRAFT_341425 [Aulographum hederae CBS 113979]
MNLLPVNSKSFAYERLPGFDSRKVSPLASFPTFSKYRWRSPGPGGDRLRVPRLSPLRILILTVTFVLLIGLLGTGGYKHRQRLKNKLPGQAKLPWDDFARLNGFYNGIGTLVPSAEFTPEQQYTNGTTVEKRELKKASTYPALDPIVYSPYKEYESYEYLADHYPVEKCYLDEAEKIAPPEIYAYPGLPQNMTSPFMGSYKELDINDGVCFERFGRFGPYGYGYPKEDGGVGLAGKSEKGGSDKIWVDQKKIDWRGVDWGDAQERCFEKNRKRFERNATKENEPRKKLVPRQAYILRSYSGYKYDEHQILTLRAMINELSLRTGGEYDVHFLVHVRDNSIPIWTDKEIYRKTLEENVPEEFWGISTLWSEKLMELYYPEPFPDNIANPSGQRVHGVYRSGHFALQWFAQHHPEYDFYWNWEMDMRYSGHYYEFHTQVSKWAKDQPRKGMWERNNQYYIPEYHGTWSEFAQRVEEQTILDGDIPVWGPAKMDNSDAMLKHPAHTTPPHSYKLDKHSWGVGEEADLITFNPIFDPTRSTWVFRDDVNGYKHSPPRRAAIVTVSRLSKRLLDTMHAETYKMRHSMFPEMIAPSIALHHGLKAVFAPHPIYFDRVWPLDFMQKTFNRPKKPNDSPFGGGEHNLLGSSFYYNAGFSGALWRRWWGYRENNEGGTKEEVGGTGRMCLRATLFHPIKKERGPTE